VTGFFVMSSNKKTSSRLIFAEFTENTLTSFHWRYRHYEFL